MNLLFLNGHSHQNLIRRLGFIYEHNATLIKIKVILTCKDTLETY